MLAVPKFAPHITATFIPDDSVVISGSGFYSRLKSIYWQTLYPLINGSNQLDQIVDIAISENPHWNTTDLYKFLFQLEKKNFLIESDQEFSDLDIFSLAVSEKKPDSRYGLQIPTLRIHQIGAIDIEPIKVLIKCAGIKLSASDKEQALDIYVTDDYLRQELKEVNQLHLNESSEWILMQLNGLEPMLGPWFHPEEGACWECLASRLKMNRDLTEFLGAHIQEGYPFPERVEVPGSALHITGMLIEQIALATSKGASNIDDAILSWNTYRSTTTTHTVVKRPQCNECGTAEQIHPPKPINLSSAPRRQASDAGYRSMTSEQVFETFKYHLSPISGVVKHLERITNPSDSIQHVYVSGQNFATSYRNIHDLSKNLRSSSCGKGTTDIQAKVSGLCEAIERYSGVFRGDEYRILSSLDQLGQTGIHPNNILLISDQQYERRHKWNARNNKFALVCEPFNPTSELEWSPVWSMTDQCTKWLPTGHLYFSYPIKNNQFTMMPCSNGASTGASLEEAVLQGFLEVVERDAFAIWWYPRTKQPQVDLSSYDLPYVRAMEKRMDDLNRELWVLDITSDLGIPVFVAFSKDTTGHRENIVFAPGAHFDPCIALLRALTELNQMLPGVQPGLNGHEYAFDDPHCVEWWTTATTDNQPYICPNKNLTMSRRDHYDVPQTTDLLEDIDIARSLVESRGMEFIIHNQTRPDIKMPVAKVIVPGMRHFWARYAPGRLFNIPVELGRLQVAPKESELNPISVFI